MMDTISCQIYEHGRGLAFHFDKDEHLLKEEGTMVHPIVNSIIYLTGDSTKSRQGVEEEHRNPEMHPYLCSPVHCPLPDAEIGNRLRSDSSCKPDHFAPGRYWAIWVQEQGPASIRQYQAGTNAALTALALSGCQDPQWWWISSTAPPGEEERRRSAACWPTPARTAS